MRNAARTAMLTAAELPRRHCGARPVLLLHGFLTTPRVLVRLADRLRRFGYCCHAVELGGLFGRYNARPVEEIALVVAARIEAIARDHGCERVDVVGHSKGGLIGRYYVQRLNGARRVRHLVTLGTPHRGTAWAYSGYLVGRLVPSLRQMVPRSALLRQLEDDTFPGDVRLTSIYSTRDAVCPPSSCRLQTGMGPHLENREVAGIGHVALLFDATIASVVRDALDRARLPRGADLVPARDPRPQSVARRARRRRISTGDSARAA